MTRIAVDRSTKMLILALMLVGIVVAGSGVAKADSFTAGTSGVLTCTSCTGSNSTSITYGSGGNTLTLTFAGATSSTFGFTPTNFDFGDLVSSVTGTGASVDTGTLTITVTQSAPSSGTGNISGTLSGTISQNGSSGQVSFSPNFVTIGGFTYTLSGSPYLLVSPNSGCGGSGGCGDTTLQGTVAGGAVPEPGSLALLGSGLAGLAGMIRRRRIF